MTLVLIYIEILGEILQMISCKISKSHAYTVLRIKIQICTEVEDSQAEKGSTTLSIFEKQTNFIWDFL